MRDPDKLPVRARGTRRVNVLIDTPAGSRNKYTYDSERGGFQRERMG